MSNWTPNREASEIDDPNFYATLGRELSALLAGERDWLANLANTAALLNTRMPQLNWVGFYLWRNGELVLGPFQGKPACVRIAPGRGVCGAAASRCETVVVTDVHQFPGHIACDAASVSEIVLPLQLPGFQIGVLDLDSPMAGRFTDVDARGLETIVGILVKSTDWPRNIGNLEEKSPRKTWGGYTWSPCFSVSRTK